MSRIVSGVSFRWSPEGLLPEFFYNGLDSFYRFAQWLLGSPSGLTYHRWVRRFDTITGLDRKQIRQHIDCWQRSPRFEIIIFADHQERAKLNETFLSLRQQLYRSFNATLVVTSRKTADGETLRPPSWLKVLEYSPELELTNVVRLVAPENLCSTWFVFLKAGMRLAEHALYWLGSEAVYHDSARFIYADHDSLDACGARINPVFKPDWSQEYLRSTNYISYAAAIRSDVLTVRENLPLLSSLESSVHGFLLMITEELGNSAIRHIPSILWHMPIQKTDVAAQSTPRLLDPVESHQKRAGVAAKVNRTHAGHYRWHYALPSELPKISIIVPTRNAVNYLKGCVESILVKSTFLNYELIVIDNQSCDQQARNYLEGLNRLPKIRILRYDKPFNYSDINNTAAKISSGEVLCLLNNDTEVITSDWLETMLGHLVQPNVGVVGAKLYYTDGRVQHGGDAVGPGGCADHLHAFLERDDPGYCDRAIVAQDISAVTGACLMTWRSIFQKLRGLDALNLPIAFNDVDYCLRVREAGYRVVWTPFAELYHHESASRGKDLSARGRERANSELAYMRRRWKQVMLHDPFYNPNLSYDRPDFSLSRSPRVKKPWREKMA